MTEVEFRTKVSPRTTKGGTRNTRGTSSTSSKMMTMQVENKGHQFVALFRKHMAKSDNKQLFVTIYKADPIEQVDVIRSGVAAEAPGKLATALHLPADQLYKHLGFARATVDRKARNKENLSQDQSERVIGLMKLIGQVQTMVEESGEPKGFDAAQWVGEWIQKPNPALGKRRPADLMDTVQGLEIVSNLLLKMQTGAYA